MHLYTNLMFQSYHHIQIAIPARSEVIARTFYVETLGFEEVRKPAALIKNGGLWLRSGKVELHLGIDPDFIPARKAHPALQVKDLDTFLSGLTKGIKYPERHKDIPGLERIFLFDPFGNRIEIIASLD